MKVFEPYHMFSIDLCDIFKDSTISFFNKFMPVIYGAIKDLFHPCPYEKVWYIYIILYKII
jgi:hypothetical protein